MRLDDVEAMFALHSDEEVMRYNYDPLVNIEQAEARFHMIEPEFREQRLLRWAITRKEDDRMIGTVIISNWIRPFASADLGYDLAREYWGRGIMTEILKRVLAFGFEEMGLNRIEASSAPENVGSRRVLEKLGFAYEGTLKEKWYMNGRYWDAVVMGLLRRDYLQRLEDGSTSSKKS
ncbi:GNAT family N-acetyltransferase [Tumebacillus permanentifrigoris]|uniref:GNAT family N-acetyltransferase n=1 Tax=Tumebacillus permanentifrigoris TaxID=378543 RepID=UPI001FE989EE|nr:GNAT family N-acetyltransferase [Tumebacillus permanentifrigoris]